MFEHLERDVFEHLERDVFEHLGRDVFEHLGRDVFEHYLQNVFESVTLENKPRALILFFQTPSTIYTVSPIHFTTNKS